MPRGPSPAITTISGASGQVMLRRPGALVTSELAASRSGAVPARDACARRRASAPRDFSTTAGSQARTSSRTGSLGVAWAGAEVSQASGDAGAVGVSAAVALSSAPSRLTASRIHRQAARMCTQTPATGQGQRASCGPETVKVTGTGGRPTPMVTSSATGCAPAPGSAGPLTGSTRPADSSARPRRSRPRLPRAIRATSSSAP